jgi:putative ABC transport system permease protein
MMLFRIALRNLGRRGRKNLVVAALIAVGIAAFLFANAVLESSIGGIQHAFSDNFTADLSVSEASDQSFSLLGPDIPVIGEYESEPVLLNAADIGVRIARLPGVAGMAYVLSSPLLVEAGGARDNGLGLGVIGSEYFSLFHGLLFTAGAPPAPGSSGWVVISQEWARKIEAAQGRPPVPGDTVQLSFFRNQSFNIREATLAGVVSYQPSNEALGRVVIVDARILRALCGYSQTDKPPEAALSSSASSNDRGATQDIDSLFQAGASPPSTGGHEADSSSPVSVSELAKIMSEARRKGAASNASPLGHDGAWHFILVRTAPGADRGRIAAMLRRDLAAAGVSIQVRDWRGTAGAVALYVSLMQFVLYVGMFMVGGIVLILTMNSLVMSVFERTSEIGTMRAIGAQQAFIRGLFIVETTSLTLISGAAGILLGAAAVVALDRASLQFTNQILILLFGGTSLHPVVSSGNIALSAIASLVLGTVAWVYPVRLALRIAPIRAIHST